MTENFGILPSGETATLYTITNGHITASVTDYGATLVRLFVPDASGNPADIVLGYDDCNGYRTANGACQIKKHPCPELPDMGVLPLVNIIFAQKICSEESDPDKCPAAW